MFRLRVLGVAGPLSILTLISCSGKSSPTQPAPAPMMVTVQVGDDFYSPQSVQINPGDTVRWVLAGSLTTHTVTDSGGAFDSGFVFTGAGASFQHQFTAADSNKTFNYSCKTHGACCGMKGDVRVGSGAPKPPPGY